MTCQVSPMESATVEDVVPPAEAATNDSTEQGTNETQVEEPKEVAIQITTAMKKMPEEDNCCLVHWEGGCSNKEVEEAVCAIDLYCCEYEWDAGCVKKASKIKKCPRKGLRP